MNNSFINPMKKIEFPKVFGLNGKLKPKQIGGMTTEPVARNLPLIKPSREPKVINYNNGGGTEKKTSSWLPDLFEPKLPKEVEKWIKENPPKNNSDSYQKKDDKSNNMWYNKNNSSSVEDAAYNAAIMKLHSEAVPSEEKLPEKLFPEKEEWEGRPSVDAETEKRMLAKQRENNSRIFWEEVDYNDLPTEEQMDFADAAFGDQPGFLENNKVLRHLRRFTDNGEPVESAITKAFGVVYGGEDLTPVKYSSNGTEENSSEKAASVADSEVEAKRQAARRKYEEKYRAELVEEKSKESSVAQEENPKTSASNVDSEVEAKRQAARRKYEERSRKEATEEETEYPQDIDEAIETYYNYFDEETRKKIREGEGIASFLDGLNPEETDQIYNYLQDKFKNLDEEVRKEFGFYTEDVFAGVPLEIRRKIFKKLKTGEEVTYDDLVEYGLYDGEEKFFAKWAANDFTSLVNKAYDAYEQDTSLDELSFEYNAQQAAQAQALFMEVLMGRVNGNPINLPNSKNKHRPRVVEPSSKAVAKKTPTDVPDDLPAEVPTTKPKNKQPQQFVDGKEFEKQFGKDLAEANVDVLEQPQIYNEDGTYTQPDFFFKTKDGRKGIIDAKLSSSTKLSKGQKKLFDTFDKFKLRLRGKRTQQFNGSEFLGFVDTYIVFDISKMEDGFFEKNNLEPIDLNEFLPGFTKGDKYGFYKYK